MLISPIAKTVEPLVAGALIAASKVSSRVLLSPVLLMP